MTLAISTKKQTNPVNEVFGKTSLNHSIALYIPSTFNVDEKINTSIFVHGARRLFSEFFGGATSYKAVGSWVSDTRGLVNESVHIIQSYADNDSFNTANLNEVRKFAEYLKLFLRQEAITLEIDNQLYFI